MHQHCVRAQKAPRRYESPQLAIPTPIDISTELAQEFRARARCAIIASRPSGGHYARVSPSSLVGITVPTAEAPTGRISQLPAPVLLASGPSLPAARTSRSQ